MTKPETEQWLVVKRNLYWRPNDCGYTGIRNHAARYTLDEAKARVGSGDHGVTMIRADLAPEFTNACFDDLARDHLTRQRDDARAEAELLRGLLRDLHRCWLSGPDLDKDAIAQEALRVCVAAQSVQH